MRGEFQPIATSLPGLQICEHLPKTARLMHKACLIRSVTHAYNAHNPLPIMTGFTGGDLGQLRPEPTDPPDIGAVCQYLGMGPKELPGAVCLPCYPGWGERSMYPGIRRPGPYGGFLGSQYDPLFAECEPTFDRQPSRPYYDPVWPMGAPTLPKQDALPEMTSDRLDRRRSLLDQLDDAFERARSTDAIDRMDRVQQRAFSLLTSAKVRDAFDLAMESDAIRDRYGRNLFGSSLLIARRLVEVGVPFISVHAENFIPHGFTYDMHENNFGMLKDYNLPVLDMGFPALVEDLDVAGPARLDVDRGHGRDGPHAASQRQGGPRPLAPVRLLPDGRRRYPAGRGLRRQRQARRLPGQRSGLAGRHRRHDLPAPGDRPAHDRPRPSRPPHADRARRRTDPGRGPLSRCASGGTSRRPTPDRR